MPKFLIFVAVGFGLAACSPKGLIDTAFPDRERFAFRTTNNETVIHYACETKGNKAATEANSIRAHRYVDAGLTRFLDRLAGIEDANNKPTTREINARTDADAKRVATTLENRFQCLAYDPCDT